MDWAQILVVILAVLFAIFLLIAIVLAVLLIKLTRQIRSVTASAERTMHALEDTVGTFNKTALPLMVVKGIASRVAKRSRKEKDGE